MAYFTNKTVYVQRIADIPSTTGYGDPLQKYFVLRWRKVGRASQLTAIAPEIPDSIPIEDPDHSPPYGVQPSQRVAWFFSLLPRKKSPTKYRRYMKLGGKDDSVIALPCNRRRVGFTLHKANRLLCFLSLKSRCLAGKGVIAIKMDAGIPLRI